MRRWREGGPLLARGGGAARGRGILPVHARGPGSSSNELVGASARGRASTGSRRKRCAVMRTFPFFHATVCDLLSTRRMGPEPQCRTRGAFPRKRPNERKRVEKGRQWVLPWSQSGGGCIFWRPQWPLTGFEHHDLWQFMLQLFLQLYVFDGGCTKQENMCIIIDPDDIAGLGG